MPPQHIYVKFFLNIVKFAIKKLFVRENIKVDSA